MPVAYVIVGEFYVTTPIYYVNDAPHVGHAYTTVNADALARWHRIAGDDVLFLTGTDEHGQKVADAAASHGVSPTEWVDRTSGRFRDAWHALDISNDDFIRTTEPRHHETVQRFLQSVYDNGYIYSGPYEGPYCVACEAYYTDDELVQGNCPVHGKPAPVLAEENYFFRLSAFADRLVELYETRPGFVRPESKRNEALAFVKGGLQDISITRTSTTWGVEVPWDPAHVFYVWYDALVNYLTAIGYGSDADRFSRWWPAVHHLIGKEIIRFHCVWWPAMCMAAGIDPPAQVFVHGWLLVGGEKMSKSGLNQIDPVALAAEVGVDALRYYLLRDTPFGPDGDFSYEGLVRRHDADLANNLGNLLARVSAVVATKCGGIGPRPRAASPLAGEAATLVEQVGAAWERIAPHDALDAAWRLIREANAMLEAAEPWKADPGPEVDGVLGDACEVLRLVALLAWPAIPAGCEEIWRRLGLEGSPGERRIASDAAWGGYPGGIPVDKGAPLFPRLAKRGA